MKKILIIVATVFCFVSQSCNKDDAATAGFDFSNTLPSYIEVVSGGDDPKAVEVKQGTSTTVTFQMRTAFQQPVTVTYDVVGTGINLTNQTAVIERNKYNIKPTINIPGGIVVAPNTATATLTLVKAVTGNGVQLTVGSKNNPATEKIEITITP